LLVLATDYGFDKNLWHNYLSFILITNENPFSITCEKVGANDGSVNYFALNDFEAFRELFDFDFSGIEKSLGIDCFTRISNYKAIVKKELMYNKNVSEKVRQLSADLEKTANAQEFFDAVTKFYNDYGVGMFGLNKAFRIAGSDNFHVEFKAINNMDKVMLDDLVGYEKQKKMLVENTKAFVEGRRANNALLFGDSGTGKSTSIKAIVNEFYPYGLRMIEIYKHQFKDLSNVIAQIKNRNYKFIIYMDDLSFEEFEIEYKFLKAVIAVVIGGFLFSSIASQGTVQSVEFACFGKYLAGLCCIVGHMFPVYFGFKGGKGVVTTAALMAVAEWRVFLVIIALFLIIFAISKIISLGSVICAVCYPIATFCFTFFVDYLPNVNTATAHSMLYVIVSTLFTLLIGLCVIIKHRSNIQRLLNGTEKKITAKK